MCVCQARNGDLSGFHFLSTIIYATLSKGVRQIFPIVEK